PAARTSVNSRASAGGAPAPRRPAARTSREGSRRRPTTWARLALLAGGGPPGGCRLRRAPPPPQPDTPAPPVVAAAAELPHYPAREKGWYREEGLDVKIVRGQGSADTVKRIAAGQGDVGIADISTVIAARANTDAKVRAIALWYRRPPHGIFLRADSPI